MNWQDIAKNLILGNKLQTAITVMRLNKVDVGEYQKSFDKLSTLKGAEKLDEEDTLAALMLASLRN